MPFGYQVLGFGSGGGPSFTYIEATGGNQPSAQQVVSFVRIINNILLQDQELFVFQR